MHLYATLQESEQDSCANRIEHNIILFISFKACNIVHTYKYQVVTILHTNIKTTICTTRCEHRLISVRCQKKCVESALVISCRMMHTFMILLSTQIHT